MLPSVLSCVGLLMMMQSCFGENRALGIPVVASSPSNCLHTKPTGLYCWYVLKNTEQVNGGMRMLSNATGVTSFISIEIGAILDSGGHPVDVGVWAQGSTSYTSVLFGGIKLSLNLHIPDATTQGGRAIANGWEIDFPFSLTSTVEIPFIGSATGKNDTTKVIAAVHKNSDARLVLFAETATKNILMESKCGLTVTISSEDLVTWHYEAYATIDVAGERAGYNVHYTNRDLLIFSGSLK